MESPRPRIRHTTGVRAPSSYPPGFRFATGRISLGEVDVIQVSTFEEVWSALEGGLGNQGVTFYEPVEVPEGYSILCHYAQENSRPRAGWVLAIKENGTKPSPSPSSSPTSSSSSSPSPPSSPSSRLNPFAALNLRDEDSKDSFNPFVGKHLSAEEAALEAEEENINPFARVAVVSASEERKTKSLVDADSSLFSPAPASVVEDAKTKSLLDANSSHSSLAPASDLVPGDTDTKAHLVADSSHSSLAPATDPAHAHASEDTKTKSLLDAVTSLFSSSPSPATTSSPALSHPSDFRLIWTSSTWPGKKNGDAWVWLPIAPQGYASLGYLVTSDENKPSTSSVSCVRTDLTDTLTTDTKFFSTTTDHSSPFTIWSTRPAIRGVTAPGVNTGSFFCARSEDPDSPLQITCLKNISLDLLAMPTMPQVEAIQRFFGPTIVFHPAEEFLPSSVSWFFTSGAMLYSKDSSSPVHIKSDGSNLPQGGTNDGTFWIDLPRDGSRDSVKKGKLDTAHVHIHVKPVYGGTFTDLQSWLFFPFNGPSTARVGKVNIPLGRLGEHVADWEHYTLRVSNFTGDLEAVYFSQHSKGNWVKMWDLEFNAENRTLVYVAKNGHPCYAHQGDHLQGDERRGVGLRNDTAISTLLLDSSQKFQVFSAEYMRKRGDNDAPEEPAWLHYMREWGPKIEYDRKKYLDKFLRFLPAKIRDSLEDVFDKLPVEVMGQEGPTGPIEKNMWNGDERS